MINFYSSDYKKYLPIAIVIFLVFLALAFVYPGVKYGIDLKGGTNIIIKSKIPLEANKIEGILKEKYPLTELQVASVSSPLDNGLMIQFSENTDIAAARALVASAKASLESNPNGAKQQALEAIEISSKYAQAPEVTGLDAESTVQVAEAFFIEAESEFKIGLQNTIKSTYGLGDDLAISVGEIGPSLGERFFALAIQASLVAFILIIIVIFLFFREIVPSIAIVAAAVFDIAGSLALMAVFQIPISLATIPALLMLIGYSVDTDVMLTTRVLKRREKTPVERANDSMITGLTMTMTTLAALTAMLVLSYFVQIQVVFEISAVLFFGLLADLISTWFMNGPVLISYAEKKEAKR